MGAVAVFAFPILLLALFNGAEIGEVAVFIFTVTFLWVAWILKAIFEHFRK